MEQEVEPGTWHLASGTWHLMAVKMEGNTEMDRVLLGRTSEFQVSNRPDPNLTVRDTLVHPLTSDIRTSVSDIW